ncbi:hypothetical protein BDV37DRAFT_222044 [Aspergillus pseudonomiae]|uniref:Uncharacterized protein n=1 Tax=Aspergillus pseudonomiae TaxID=1506151 RepID=A0A5N7DNW9_9EURO|nr:uncharacterized protein BDV37DRAFT_222044 [Aspergillus pseudonomiae]KAE8407709.1 hypothetical protein BDV37DRAFT_222044 [Aspergillus pseudonomiae]
MMRCPSDTLSLFLSFWFSPFAYINSDISLQLSLMFYTSAIADIYFFVILRHFFPAFGALAFWMGHHYTLWRLCGFLCILHFFLDTFLHYIDLRLFEHLDILALNTGNIPTCTYGFEDVLI